MGGPLKIVIMGVSGCGKSSVGAALAAKLGVVFVDGDNLHPPANISKMSMGSPLTDADRWPWLNSVAEALMQVDETAIIGCSALKRTYRDYLRRVINQPLWFVHLAGSRSVIVARMQERDGHFMPSSLLDSQFAALEPPDADELAITADIDQPLERIIAAVSAALENLK